MRDMDLGRVKLGKKIKRIKGIWGIPGLPVPNPRDQFP